jgi:hypothetical protein
MHTGCSAYTTTCGGGRYVNKDSDYTCTLLHQMGGYLTKGAAFRGGTLY